MFPQCASRRGWLAAVFAAVALVGATAATVRAQDAVTIELSIKNHQFVPAEIKVPARKALRLHVRNLDSVPAEFESVSLRVEKVVTGNGQVIINLRPLAAGRYSFFDDFHQETKGALVAQ